MTIFNHRTVLSGSFRTLNILAISVVLTVAACASNDQTAAVSTPSTSSPVTAPGATPGKEELIQGILANWDDTGPLAGDVQRCVLPHLEGQSVTELAFVERVAKGEIDIESGSEGDQSAVAVATAWIIQCKMEASGINIPSGSLQPKTAEELREEREKIDTDKPDILN